MFTFRRQHILCLCCVTVLLAGSMRLGKVNMRNAYAEHSPSGQKPPAAWVLSQEEPTPPGDQVGDPIGQGKPAGILYYMYHTNQNIWTVGVHNGIALDNITQGIPDVPLGHFSDPSFKTEDILCFHKPTTNDTLGGYRRIATRPYRGAYTNRPPIGYRTSDGKINNAAFGSFTPDDPTVKPINNVDKAIAYLGTQNKLSGTLTYGHWNIGPSTSTSGAQDFFWEVKQKPHITRIARLVTFPKSQVYKPAGPCNR